MANRRSRDYDDDEDDRPRRRRDNYDDDDDDDYDDRPRRRGSDRDAGPSSGLVLGIVGGVLALVAIVVGIIIYSNRRAQREEEQEVARQQALIAQEEDRPQAEIANGFRGDNNAPGGDNHNRVALPKPGGGGGIEHNDNSPPQPEPEPQPQPNTPVPPLPAGLRETMAQGPGGARKRFREFRQNGTALVGFEVGCGSVDGKPVVSYLQPIYRTPDGKEELGTAYGRSSEEHVTVKAKEGYALGAIVFSWSETRCIDSIRFRFMKIVPEGLDPSEWSVSDWYGAKAGKQDPAEPQRNAPKVVPLIVGIHGLKYEDTGGDEPRQSGTIARLGLVAAPNKTTADALAAVVPNAPNAPDTSGLGLPDLPVPRPLPGGWQQSKTLGSGGLDTEFNEYRTDGSLLVGFEVGNDMLYLRPIWLTPGGVEEFGTVYGKKSDAITTLKAKEGYAVSGIIAPNAASRLDLIALTFAKQIPKKGLTTNKKDMYTSDWVGNLTSKDRAETVSALGGFPVLGIHGRRNALTGDITSIGLIVPNKLDGWQNVIPPLDKLPTFKPERIKLPGSDGANSFDDAAPAGGWLVGIEAHVVKWENSEVIGSVRPMFMTGNKSSDGGTHGKAANATDKVVRVAAKPGYAIGAMNVKAGTDVYGFSVTYMKVTGGKLNPKDSYQSEWVGSNPDVQETALKGEGRPVVGLCGRSPGEDKPIFAIGLLVAPADGK
jgi:type II secretory pathway pseudopilin PulG